jgi:hypothetical protein
MSIFNQEPVLVTRYVRRMRGDSQPVLAEASDGLLYLVKYTNNLQDANLAFNESAGSELYRAFGLAVPAWKPLLLTDYFLDQSPACWIEGAGGPVRPNSGLCFGSRFLGGNGIRLLEIIPKTSFTRIRNHYSFCLAWMVDICARHVNNRQAIFLEGAQGALKAFFIDNGDLFGNAKSIEEEDFLTSRYFDSRIYHGVSSDHLRNLQRDSECADVDRLWKRMRALPDDWKTRSAVDGFAQCLERLSNARLRQDIVDTIASVCRWSDDPEQSGFQ